MSTKHLDEPIESLKLKKKSIKIKTTDQLTGNIKLY